MDGIRDPATGILLLAIPLLAIPLLAIPPREPRGTRAPCAIRLPHCGQRGDWREGEDPAVWWKRLVAGTGIRIVRIRQEPVLQPARLPDLYGDHIDRILVAQAMVENAVIVSKDERLATYGLAVVW